MSSIALAPDSDLRYQGVARFETGEERLKGHAWPMILVSAFDVETGELIYRELARDVEGVADAVLLGGGSSAWVSRGGGPAHCTAALYSYNRQGDITLLAGPIEFDAAG